MGYPSLDMEELKLVVFHCRLYTIALLATVIPLVLLGWFNTAVMVIVAFLGLFNLFLILYWGGKRSLARGAVTKSDGQDQE